MQEFYKVCLRHAVSQMLSDGTGWVQSCGDEVGMGTVVWKWGGELEFSR